MIDVTLLTKLDLAQRTPTALHLENISDISSSVFARNILSFGFSVSSVRLNSFWIIF